MADAIASRLGQVNQTGNERDLFLKVFSGEVMTQFTEKNIMMNLHTVRTINSGKSAQFPVMGTADAYYHTPGQEILGGKISHAERVINIDHTLIAPMFIPNLDEAMNHYDVRSQYAKEGAAKLANEFDKRVLRLTILAARDSETVVGTGKNGAVVSATNFNTATNIIKSIFSAAEALDAKDVPEDERYAILSPKDYYTLVQDQTAINRDWGGQGAFADGTVLKIAGITILKSNHLPSGVIESDALEKNDYSGDFTKTKGVVFHKSAVGTVKLMDLAVESEYQMARQGTLMIPKYAMGHGILRPEASVELAVA